MILYGKKSAGVVAVLAAIILLSLSLAACSPNNTQTPSPSKDGTTAPEQKLSLPVYYVKMTMDDIYLIREVHQVPLTQEVARASLEELIKVNPVTPGASRVLPPATQIRGITIKDGLATVDFSQEVLRANVGAATEALGLQSIVNTLTEIPGVQKVSFMVEGKVDQECIDWWGHVGLYEQPFSRDISKTYEPAIWVTAPVPGQKVGSTVDIRGAARVYEGTVGAMLIDHNGTVLAESFGTATEGAPGRGEFNFSLTFDNASQSWGELEVFWESPIDGNKLDKVAIPVNW